MKAIIIENELQVDGYIQCFLKDNPTLFESVQEELYCLQRGTKSLLPEILKNDAIIVASTFMYKDQLEEFLEAFSNPKFPKKMKFFVHWITNKLLDWKHPYVWSSDKDLFKKVKKMIENGHTLYDFNEDYDSEKNIMDNLDGYSHFGRGKYVYHEVKYSKEHDIFYTDSEYYNLKTMLDEEKQRKTRTT